MIHVFLKVITVYEVLTTNFKISPIWPQWDTSLKPTQKFLDPLFLTCDKNITANFLLLGDFFRFMNLIR